MPAPVSNTNNLYNEDYMSVTFAKLHYVPITGFLCSLLAMLVPYAISVYLGDSPLILPFISDAGGDPPQSIVFGLLLSAMSFVGAVGMYMKYLMVLKQHGHSTDVRVKQVNRWSCTGGVLVCLGGLIVSLLTHGTSAQGLHVDGREEARGQVVVPSAFVLSVLLLITDEGCYFTDAPLIALLSLMDLFPQYWPMFVPHMIGACMVFGIGYATTLMHLYLQYLTDQRWRTSPVFYVRALLSFVGITAMMITGFNWLFFDMALMIPPGGRGKVYPQGMLGAVIAEWVMVFIFQSYVLTFVPDFRKTTFVLNVKMDSVRTKKE